AKTNGSVYQVPYKRVCLLRDLSDPSFGKAFKYLKYNHCQYNDSSSNHVAFQVVSPKYYLVQMVHKLVYYFNTFINTGIPTLKSYILIKDKDKIYVNYKKTAYKYVLIQCSSSCL